jgi:predicted transcriptional regulator
MEKQGAASKVRALFIEQSIPLTLTDIAAQTDLKSPQISMALCYLRRQRYLSRNKVSNTHTRGRKEVWQYEYHPNRIS